MNKIIFPPVQSKPRLFLGAIGRVQMLQEQNRYEEALAVCLQATCTHPDIAALWIEAVINCAMLKRWQDAIRYGKTALTCGGNTLRLYDVLAYSYGHLGLLNEARHYGLQALNIRVQRFSGEPVIPLPEPKPLPPPPSAQACEHNIIAFSLFGNDSKYCESAVLNVQEQPVLYPH
ncbi:MAG: hypothetical protein LBH10_02690, partial [Burkholderiaceae bacterium]|nr:hypothetical protein [Burkholderiaceae bacterium]